MPVNREWTGVPVRRKEGMNMKQSPRKLLSLLMAFAVVLSLLPGMARAATTSAFYNVSESSMSLEVGQTKRLTLTLKNPDAYSRAFHARWRATGAVSISEGNGSVGGFSEVDSSGISTASRTIKANREGTGTIYVELVPSGNGNNSIQEREIAICEVTVTAPTVTEDLEITPISNNSTTISASSPTNNSTTLRINNSYTGNTTFEWKVTGGSSAVTTSSLTGSPTLTLTARAVAVNTPVTVEATMTLPDGSKHTGTARIIVLGDAKADRIVLSGTGVGGTQTPFSLSMTTASNATVTASVQTANGTAITGATIDSVASTNEKVCKVSRSGNTITVTPVAAGAAAVTVTYGTGASAISSTLNVTVTHTMTTVSFNPASPLSLQVLGTQNVTASVPNGISYSTVTWAVKTGSDKVTVTPFTGSNQNMVAITGKAAGTATITATFKNSAGTIVGEGTFTVNVGSVSNQLTLSNNLTLSNTNNTNSYGTITASLSNATSSAKYSVRWTTSNASIAYFYNSANASSATTTFTGMSSGYYTSPVTIYAGRTSGTATITAQLYYDGRAVGNPVTRTVTVGNTVLTPSAYSITIPYNSWSSYFSVTSTTANGSWVRWSVPSTSYVTLSATSNSNVNSGYQVDTPLGSSRYAGIYLYGSRNGTSTTLTATLYNSSNQVLGSIQIPVTVGNTGFTVVGTPNTSNVVNLNNYSSSTANGYYCDFSVDPRVNGASIRNSNSAYDIYYTWTLNGYTVQNSNTGYNGYTYRLYANNQYLNRYLSSSSRYNVLTCTVDVYNRGASIGANNRIYTGSASWNITTGYNTQFTVSATVYDSNPGYALTDIPDGTTTSIADQIDSWVRNNYYYNSSSYYRNYDVRVYGGTAYESGTSGNRGTLTTNSSWLSSSDLSRIVFTPGSTVSSANGSYQVSFNFDVRIYTSSSSAVYDTASGTMVFTVRQGAAPAGNINYSSELGKDVYFNVSDFENFWTDIYSRGSLSYVTFGSVSGGTVYNSSNKSVGSTSCYVSPRGNQSGLDGVYFSPNSATSRTATTIRIPFTAYGTTSSNGSVSTTPRSGTIVITYLSAAASTITYSTSASGTVSLKAQDFIDAYKAAVKTSSTPSNLTIVFQNVPSYGTLSYKDSSKSNSSSVRLTSSNIKSRSFTTRSSGTNQLGDVTYTASSTRTETISYIGYIGSTATFTGEVTFNAVTAPTDVRVTLPACYSASGVALNWSYFTSANANAMANASYITFGSPRTGKLVSSGASSTAVSVGMLNTVTYVPAASPTSTTDSFTFTAYNSANTIVASGTVAVVVSLPASSGGITNINQFTDIPAAGPTSDWYRPQLTYLINKGVINGKGNGKFGPEDALAYGEALKMIMNAAGYYEPEADESQANVSHWAQNYKNTAVQKGWLQSNVNLRATISRDSMAELTARVLGIAAATNQTSPFADSTNAYAIALYNSKIVQGELWDDGTRHFTPNKALTRNEMVCLVYNMYQYTGK